MFHSLLKSLSLGLSTLTLSFILIGCGSLSDTFGTSSDNKEAHPDQVINILFAHGFMSNSDTWNYFSQVTADTINRTWTVYKTNVAKTGTITERASALTDYINEQNLADNSLLVVGHSMGGLDLRYIISEGNQDQTENNKYYQASKKIYKLYTIATPHKGSDVANLVARDSGAVHDLSSGHMTNFNIQHPYTNSSVDSRAIPMLAFRFSCQNDDIHDGVVALDSQVLENAPYTQDILDGKHTSGLKRICENDVTEELLQSSVIEGILNNTTPKETL